MSSPEVKGIEKIKIQDKRYPVLLKKIKDPPEALYFRGKVLAKENCFAIVGTRRCSVYGKQAALEIAGDLADAGLTIVSGLALGIDSSAHLATIERNKRTIAVLGTGLDEKSIYPRQNLKLAQKILEAGGALVSEYEPNVHGSEFTFPQRNRLISGISLGVLVVEAKQRSGALITANWAKKQGKKIFAVPGPVYSSNSRGCHYLIKKGAKLAESAQDILKELNSCSQLNLLAGTKPELGLKAQTTEEQLILQALKQGSLHIDEIIEKTGLSAPKVIGCLAVLEIKGKVRNLGGNIYALSRKIHNI